MTTISLNPGVKTVAVIGLQNDWGLSATGEFAKAFEALGGKLIELGTAEWKGLAEAI